MIRRSLLLFSLFFLFFIAFGEGKTLDPYKVLGVDKNASQRDIQKAFHKLSLQYHPDKNKNKGAQEKFAEINNAYEILSDEDKKKNYDLYGDEKGNPGFDGGNFGGGDGYDAHQGGDGYTYFTSSGRPGGGGPFTTGPGGWQTMGGQGNAKSFSFSFGGDPSGSGSPFGFNLGDMLFGGGMKSGSRHGGFSGGNQHGGFTGSGGSRSGFASTGNVEDIDSQFFNRNIKDKGLTWLLLFYTPNAKGYHLLESIAEDVISSLQGAMKAGKINCMTEKSLCNDLGVSVPKAARLFVYSFRSGDRGSLVEYTGELEARSLKAFSQDQLPKFSKRVDLGRFEFSSSAKENRQQVLLLSTKKDTPVMWRVLSGLYHTRFAFYDAEVPDASHPMLKRLGVDAFPAVIGRLVNGEEHVLRAGIAVKDLKSGVHELKALLESFEKKNKKVSSQEESHGKGIPHLSSLNMDSVCGDKTPLCIIGVFRSTKGKEKLEATLSEVSQKTLLRRQNQAGSAEIAPSSAMEAHHASLGRRTLEEIRQKRAAERFQKASSGSESEFLNPYEVNKSDGGNRTAEIDTLALQARVKELENKNAELKKENQNILSQIEEKKVENDSLLKRLNELEQNSLPSLRKALKDVSIEKDAAIVAKEDALSQLRTIKRRLKEAEEEQYRAEEDAAALRAELNSLQQQNVGNLYSNIHMTSKSEEQILAMEKEIMDLKSDIQQMSVLRQQEQHKLIEEQLRSSTLLAEKQDLEDKFVALSKQVSEEASETAARQVFSLQDKARLEEQLHDMALMVERLESGRQKLLLEIDSQSSEIEMLFEENSNLSSSYQDALGLSVQWENQVKECLKQNEELRGLLDKLRFEQVNSLRSSASDLQLYAETAQNGENIYGPSEIIAENLLLKDGLAKEQTRAEALAAEIMKLSAEFKHVSQLYNNLTRIYKPVLRNIENSLMKMKQESYVTVQ